jgi:hypothetical protein
MKRILGMVVAIAGVLAFGSAATAAQVTFDLSGTGTSWSRSTDVNASIPGAPNYGGTCTPGMESAPAPSGEGNDCFRYSFQPGSSVTVDITGSYVTMIGGTILIDTTLTPTPLVFGTINLTSVVSTTIFGATAYTPAATGTLVGDQILWTTAANISPSGPDDTLRCDGPNCALISLPDGVAVPFEPIFSAIANSTSVTAFDLGTWQLNGAHDAIIDSTLVVNRWSNVAQLDNRRDAGLTFGGAGLGVPEPGTAALILLGLGALALRSRKA